MGSAIGDRHERRKRNAVTASKIAFARISWLRRACAAFRNDAEGQRARTGKFAAHFSRLITIRVRKAWPGGTWLRKAIIHSYFRLMKGRA
jgi:hypothetical protein